MFYYKSFYNLKAKFEIRLTITFFVYLVTREMIANLSSAIYAGTKHLEKAITIAI